MISIRTIERAAGAKGWPRVPIHTLIVEGEAAWRRALSSYPPPTPGELRLLLEALGMSWLCDELVATPAAWSRLEAWIAAGSKVPSGDDLVRKLQFVGDDEVRNVVLRALHERIPPPVVAYLLESVLFSGVGWSAVGYMIRVAMPAGPLLTIIPLSGASRDPAIVLDISLHEAAHAYLMPAPGKDLIPAEAMHNERGAMLLKAAKRPDLMRDILAADFRDEEAADSLARAWGGKITCSAERGRDYTIATAQRLQQTYGRAETPAPNPAPVLLHGAAGPGGSWPRPPARVSRGARSFSAARSAAARRRRRVGRR
jgi:hypothetical protein